MRAVPLLDCEKCRGHTLPPKKLKDVLPNPLFGSQDNPLAPNGIENTPLLNAETCRSRQPKGRVEFLSTHGVYPVSSTYPRPDRGSPPRVPETVTAPSQYRIRVSSS